MRALVTLLLATVLLNVISFAEASSPGFFQLCDERSKQGSCQRFDLSKYTRGVVHAINFKPMSGYDDYDNLGDDTYIRFQDENGVILCTLSRTTGFTIRDVGFFKTHIASFRWGEINDFSGASKRKSKPSNRALRGYRK